MVDKSWFGCGRIFCPACGFLGRRARRRAADADAALHVAWAAALGDRARADRRSRETGDEALRELAEGLSYEDQSQIIGDPIAETIMRETP